MTNIIPGKKQIPHASLSTLVGHVLRVAGSRTIDDEDREHFDTHFDKVNEGHKEGHGIGNYFGNVVELNKYLI